ncbi:MAG: MoaD/ThiS family protein [Halobacteriales archaeon]|nr:MoaD/ThiS family protein [Halobacteriales archaeon]
MRVLLRKLGPDRGEQQVEVRAGALVRDALRAAGIHPETVLVARGKVVLPDDEAVRDGDELLVTRVVTGG